MFENMSKREQVMAIAVGGMAVLLVAYFGWSTISEMHSTRNNRLQGLTQELDTLKTQVAKGKAANKRFKEYQQTSLPSDSSTSVTQYQLWLEELLKENKIDASVLVKNRSTPQLVAGANPRKPAYGKYMIDVTRVTCNLRQLTQFLYRFNQTNLMHRIKDITITPLTSGSGKRIEPTGDLAVTIKIELVCMPTAESERAFENELVEVPKRTLDEYMQTVALRDLFGLPNRKPELDADSSFEFELGERVSIDLDGDDPDPGQVVSYEISNIEIDPDDPNAKFETSDVQLSGGYVNLGNPPLGVYSFEVTATDDGWGNLSTKKKITVEVYETKQEVITIRPESRDTRITGKASFGGTLRVWIWIQPRDEYLKLEVGDSFLLDEKTWVLEEIGEEFVVISCDGEALKFRYGGYLGEPVEDDSLGPVSIDTETN